MTAAQVLLAAGHVLHGPDSGRSVANPRSPRGIVLRAMGYLATENRNGAVAELSRLDAAMTRYDQHEAEAHGDITSRVTEGPHVAYCRDTGLIWGYGATLARAQADAGWHCVEAGAGDQMATLAYLPAGAGMLEALERYGSAMPWSVCGGFAVPAGE